MVYVQSVQSHSREGCDQMLDENVLESMIRNMEHGKGINSAMWPSPDFFPTFRVTDASLPLLTTLILGSPFNILHAGNSQFIIVIIRHTS